MGQHISELRRLIGIKQKHELECIWMSDPMHGNTVVRGGIKTRYIETMGEELTQMRRLLLQMGEDLGGLHLEARCEEVTECL